MKKYLLSACILSLISTSHAWAYSIDNWTEISSSHDYDNLGIGPNATAHFCAKKDGSCSNAATPIKFNVSEDVAINGGTVKLTSADMTQKEENRTQGVILKDGADVSLDRGTLETNSRLEINSGSVMTVGSNSSVSVTANTTASSPSQGTNDLPTPGEIKIENNSVLNLESGTIALEDGSVLANSTTVSGNSVLSIKDSSLNMKDHAAVATSLTVEDDITLSNAKVSMSGVSGALNTIRTTTGDIIITDSAILGTGNVTNNIIAAGDIGIFNNEIPTVEVEIEKEETGDTDTNTENEEEDKIETITNGNNALTNVSLSAGNDIALYTNGNNVSATAGRDITLIGDYTNLHATAGLNNNGNMTVNADIKRGSLVAGSNIDYQKGIAVLNGLNATKTTIQEEADITLSYGTGGGDIVSYGTLTLENFQLIDGLSNNIDVVDSELKASWNNEIAGNLTLENSTMSMKKNSTTDGWIRVGSAENLPNRSSTGNVSIKNSIVDIDTAYIEASGSININAGSTIIMRIAGAPISDKSTYGHIIANEINIENGAKMVLTVDGDALSKGETRNYELLNVAPTNGKLTLEENSRYSYVDKGDGTYDITLNTTASDMAGEQTGNDNLSDMAGSLLDGAALDNKFVQHLNTLSQTPGHEKDFAEGLETLAPTITPYITALANDTVRQIYNVIGTRYDKTSAASRRIRTNEPNTSMWVQGLASTAEFDSDHYFETESTGGAVGFDVDPCPGCRIGIGYAYTQSEIEALNRTADVDTHAAIIYASLQGNPVYLNAFATYMRSMFDETKDVIGLTATADYDVDVIAAQAMIGYDLGPIRLNRRWKTGSFMPEIGARYTQVKQKGYTDSADQKVSDADATTVTGIAGMHYTADYRLGNFIFYPDLKAAVTYDFVQDEMTNTISLSGGSDYRLTAERLDKLGFELGAEAGIRIGNNAEVGLNYLGIFKKDYTNHSGLVNLKIKF